MMIKAAWIIVAALFIGKSAELAIPAKPDASSYGQYKPGVPQNPTTSWPGQPGSGDSDTENGTTKDADSKTGPAGAGSPPSPMIGPNTALPPPSTKMNGTIADADSPPAPDGDSPAATPNGPNGGAFEAPSPTMNGTVADAESQPAPISGVDSPEQKSPINGSYQSPSNGMNGTIADAQGKPASGPDSSPDDHPALGSPSQNGTLSSPADKQPGGDDQLTGGQPAGGQPADDHSSGDQSGDASSAPGHPYVKRNPASTLSPYPAGKNSSDCGETGHSPYQGSPNNGTQSALDDKDASASTAPDQQPDSSAEMKPLPDHTPGSEDGDEDDDEDDDEADDDDQDEDEDAPKKGQSKDASEGSDNDQTPENGEVQSPTSKKPAHDHAGDRSDLYHPGPSATNKHKKSAAPGAGY